jgi:hypothetical protein
VLGCGPSAVQEDDAGNDDPPIPWTPPLPELEPNCPDVDFPPLGPSAALSGDVMLLPCGEVWSSWQGGLLYPDGELVLFEDGGFSSRKAPASGDLLAPEAIDPNILLLVDVHARTSRELGDVDWDGWVPSFDERAWGAWKWTCTDGVLEIHDPEQSVILDEGVTCLRVEASAGAPLLVYDTGETLHLANVDEQTVVDADLPPFQYQWDSPCYPRIVVDYDGRFASLQQVCTDTPEQEFLMIFSAVDGSRVVHEPGPWEALSIAGREQGFVIYDGETLRGLGPEGLHEIATDIRFATGNTRLYAQRRTDDAKVCELLRGDATSLESLGLGPCVDSLLARPDHAGIVTFRAGDNNELMETWTAEAGWAWPQPIVSVEHEWSYAIMHSDGTTLAYEAHPEGRVIVVSPAGEVLAQWTGYGVDRGDEHFVIRSEGETEGIHWEAATIVDRSGQIVFQPVGELEATRVGVSSIPYASEVVAIGRRYENNGLAWYGTYP